MMKDFQLTFILGGARSGKSDYSLELAHHWAGDAPVLFIATAQLGDEEMAERIIRHRDERPAHWYTLEAPLNVGNAMTEWLAQADGPTPAVCVLDCLTLLASNVLFSDGDVEQQSFQEIQTRLDRELDALLAAMRGLDRPCIMVSNEVGLGIVPMGAISRTYRDLIGRANRRLADEADHALFLMAGIPLDLKKLQADLIGK